MSTIPYNTLSKGKRGEKSATPHLLSPQPLCYGVLYSGNVHSAGQNRHQYTPSSPVQPRPTLCQILTKSCTRTRVRIALARDVGEISPLAIARLESMKAFVGTPVKAGLDGSASDDMRILVRENQKYYMQEQLEARLPEALERIE